MKKIVISLFVLALTTSSLWAETDAKTADFLKRLNKLYYSAYEQGLRKYACDMTITTSAIYKSSLEDMGAPAKLMNALDGQKLSLTFDDSKKSDMTRPEKVEVIKPLPSGSIEFDHQLKNAVVNVANTVAMVLKTWVDDAFYSGFDDHTLSKLSFKVTQLPTGFVVDQYSVDGTSDLQMTFDKTGKMTSGVGIMNGKQILSMVMAYSSTPQGYQMDGYDIDAPKMGLKQSVHFEYALVGKYVLLKKAVIEVEMGQMITKGSAITLDFSNYKLDQ